MRSKPRGRFSAHLEVVVAHRKVSENFFRVAQAAFAWVLFDHGYTLDIVRAVLSIQFGASPVVSPKKLDPFSIQFGASPVVSPKKLDPSLAEQWCVAFLITLFLRKHASRLYSSLNLLGFNMNLDF